jgi:hypothetical protein
MLVSAKLTRRGFLKLSFIGFAAIVSACAKVLNKPVLTATPASTATVDTSSRVLGQKPLAFGGDLLYSECNGLGHY